MAAEERTIQLSTREFLGDRLRPYEPSPRPGAGYVEMLVGRWIAGGRVSEGPPLVHRGDAVQVVRELGRGALGEVYEVKAGNRSLALKLPIAPLERTAPAIRNEIEKLARLEHPNLPRLHGHGLLEIGDLHDVPYYLTDLLEPLTAALPTFGQGKPLDPLAVARIFHALARALSYLANQGIVHNDVKPENILLAAGRPVLVDWGTARSTSEINELEQNRLAGRLFGTPRWLPPEIVEVVGEDDDAWVMLYPDRISQKTDVYGLGLVVLRLLSGRDLFEEPLGADIVKLFQRFHHLMRHENLLGRYLEQVQRLLVRSYLGTDPISESRIRSENLQRLYRRFDAPTTATLPRHAPPPSTTRRKRLFGGSDEPTPPPRMRGRFTGVEARRTFVEDLLRLVRACLAPYEERIKAPALVSRIESTWPGIA